jgi:DNA-binding PadR family transcriptional regulator
MKELTRMEEMVITAIFRLGETAYGVKIKKEIQRITGREYLYSTLYSTFEQLVRKGHIVKQFGDPTAVRGGKRKVFFQLTRDGLAALENTFKHQQKIWSGISTESIKKGYI